MLTLTSFDHELITKALRIVDDVIPGDQSAAIRVVSAFTAAVCCEAPDRFEKLGRALDLFVLSLNDGS